MNKILYILIGLGVLVLIFLGVWFLLAHKNTDTASTTESFGSLNNNSTSVGGNGSTSGDSTNGTAPVSQTQPSAQQKIFEVAQGPVVSATLIQNFGPTTTLARYIDANNGHVYDLPLDVPGAVPRVVSNTTVPGGYRAIWLEGGKAAVMQYLEGSVIKTVYLGFPASSTLPARIQFFPDNIADIAASPDTTSVVYLLTTPSGTDGYIAASNGSDAKKLFSLPLSQLLVSWPSQGTLLVQTKSAAGVAGIAFSVNAKTGAATPLVYAQGLTAIADASFSHVMYQTSQVGSSYAFSFLHDVKSGADTLMSFDPYPEKCLPSRSDAVTLYCASPLSYVGPTYLDAWHQGALSAADELYAFNLQTGTTTIIASPGSNDGGAQTDIFQLMASPDDHYLLYIAKGNRSLWGVRLTQ